MKKIVMITPALVTGGAETMVTRLVTNLDPTQFDINVICLGFLLFLYYIFTTNPLKRHFQL